MKEAQMTKKRKCYLFQKNHSYTITLADNDIYTFTWTDKTGNYDSVNLYDDDEDILVVDMIKIVDNGKQGLFERFSKTQLVIVITQLVIFALAVLVLISCLLGLLNNSNGSNNDIKAFVESKDKLGVLSQLFHNLFKSSDPSSVSSIEDAKEFLDGKTFISTPIDADGSIWIKATFSGNTFKLWMVAPHAGSWGNAVKSVTYKIKESRYTNTGQRFYYAELVSAIREGESIREALDRISNELFHDVNNATSLEQRLIYGIIRMSNIDFIVNESAFSLFSLQEGEDIRYKATEGDKNPWN
jgi:hypothetical protein